ncbi:hypothetical protein QC761_0086190 [Podospora bellae-mahoneyi]|uniref:Uncharacterized protein n=1 Tax=Podospora bellae-mahoneyi TaxID=2093777 RepID=A0ABR0FF60_9PEZI|nr:hypothetical protein QC761_0086190 [Podospora bellae-mahoneyi]
MPMNQQSGSWTPALSIGTPPGLVAGCRSHNPTLNRPDTGSSTAIWNGIQAAPHACNKNHLAWFANIYHSCVSCQTCSR